MADVDTPVALTRSNDILLTDENTVLSLSAAAALLRVSRLELLLALLSGHLPYDRRGLRFSVPIRGIRDALGLTPGGMP